MKSRTHASGTRIVVFLKQARIDRCNEIVVAKGRRIDFASDLLFPKCFTIAVDETWEVGINHVTDNLSVKLGVLGLDDARLEVVQVVHTAGIDTIQLLDFPGCLKMCCNRKGVGMAVLVVNHQDGVVDTLVGYRTKSVGVVTQD